jgi:hypothetical protein
VLEIERTEVDADRFESLAGAGRRELEASDRQTAVECLREAVGLWRGEPLAEFAYEPFAQSEIARAQISSSRTSAARSAARSTPIPPAHAPGSVADAYLSVAYAGIQEGRVGEAPDLLGVALGAAGSIGMPPSMMLVWRNIVNAFVWGADEGLAGLAAVAAADSEIERAARVSGRRLPRCHRHAP